MCPATIHHMNGGTSATYKSWARRQARAAETIRVQAGIIDRCEQACGGDLTTADPVAVAEWVTAAGRSRETIRAYSAALRAAARAGAIPDHVVSELPRLRTPRHQPRPCPERVVAHLLAAPDQADRAAFTLMAYAGLRISEVGTIQPDDVSEDPTGGWWVRVTGKGGVTRVAPIPSWAAGIVVPALPLTMTVQTLRRHTRARMREAGYQGTPHQLRHFYACSLLRQCHDVRVVQDALGHASIATTMVYTVADRPTATAAVESMRRPAA